MLKRCLEGWSEAPAELAPHWFGRSLTLRSNNLIGQSQCKHFYWLAKTAAPLIS